MQHLQPGLDGPLSSRADQLDSITRDRVVHTSHVPDLPAELWMEILSYLPQGFLRKMIGVNRCLFEQGMNEIYREVRMCEYHGVELKTFEQMRYPSISARVRSLWVQPNFLPGLWSVERTSWDNHKEEIKGFLDMALVSLSGCIHLQDLTVVLQDLHLPSSFSSFLKKLIKRIGPQLRTLTFEVTCSCFLSIHHLFPKRLSNLSSLSLAMIDSQFPPSATEVRRACRALSDLITSTKKTLHSLSLESFSFSFVDFFLKLPTIPPLRSFEVRASYCSSTLSPGTHLRTLLQKQADNLERLAIRQPRVSDKGSWVPDPTLRMVFDPVFTLQMSNLQELDLEIEYRVILTRLTHYIITFVPRLKKLILWGQHATLAYDGFLELLDRLCNSGARLEYLRISVAIFSPDHLDTLSNRLLQLKSLDIRYERLRESRETEEFSEGGNEVYEAFRSRRYPRWELEGLKIMHLPEVPRAQGYPDTKLINSIAESLPSLTRVVRSWEEEL